MLMAVALKLQNMVFLERFLKTLVVDITNIMLHLQLMHLLTVLNLFKTLNKNIMADLRISTRSS
jgi:hypothetical protein